nr:RNA-directed DNA polymerase, eukaryota, reverse transcriptase zinc-binding domain protein [Tanacetum cinerariifolium]
MAGKTVKEMTTNFGKLDKFEGHDFRQWQKKMHFLLTTLKVVTWNLQRSCRILLNPSTWQRMLLVRSSLLYTQHGLKMVESIFVLSVIDKFPPSWKEFKHTLKHGKDDLSLVHLGSHLCIKESLRVQESDKGKGKEVVGPSVNMTEEVETKRITQVLVVWERGLRTNPKTKVDAIMWWIDFGATTHVCKDRCWFKTYERVEDGFVLYMGIIHETTAPYTPQQNGVAESILPSRKLGGLGVGSLHAKNLRLLGKWKWRFLTEKDALWRKVINSFYGRDGGFVSGSSGRMQHGVWCEIVKEIAHIEKLDSSFSSSFKLKVSNSSNTLFWKDRWCVDSLRLMDRFPRLFALDMNQNYSIRDRWIFSIDSWIANWNWRFCPRGHALDDLSNILLNMGDLVLSNNSSDSWFWDRDSSGSFKVNTLSVGLQDIIFAEDHIGAPHLWNSWIPRKINLCVWRASINRLPTWSNLAFRGLALRSVKRPFCDIDEEVLDHCILKCPHVISIWRKMWSWWQLSTLVLFSSFSIKDISIGCFVNIEYEHVVYESDLSPTTSCYRREYLQAFAAALAVLIIGAS